MGCWLKSTFAAPPPSLHNLRSPSGFISVMHSAQILASFRIKIINNARLRFPNYPIAAGPQGNEVCCMHLAMQHMFEACGSKNLRKASCLGCDDKERWPLCACSSVHLPRFRTTTSILASGLLSGVAASHMAITWRFLLHTCT